MWEGAPDLVTTAAVLLLLGLCTGLLRLRRTAWELNPGEAATRPSR